MGESLLIQLLILDTKSGVSRNLDLEGPVVLGSAFDCELVLPGEGIAPRHCRLEPTAEGVRATDLESETGIQWNGQWIGRANLGPGDMLQVGPYRIVLSATGGTGASQPPAAVPSTAASQAPPAVKPAGGHHARRARARVAAKRAPERESRAAESRGRPARRRSGTGSGGGGGGAVGAVIGVVVIIVLVAFFSMRFGRDGGSSGGVDVGEAIAAARALAVEGRFEEARSRLDLASKGASDRGRTDLRDAGGDLDAMEQRHDRAQAEIQGAIDQAASDPEAAVVRLDRVSRDYADIFVVRRRAEQQAEAFRGKVAASSFGIDSSELLDRTDIPGGVRQAKGLSDGEQFSRALSLLGNLRPSSDSERAQIDRAREEVQAAARKIGDVLLRRVDETLSDGHYILALNMLSEEELRPLRGTDVWYDLLDKAEEVEDVIDANIPASARPFPRRKHARERPKKTDTSRAAPPAEPTQLLPQPNAEVARSTDPSGQASAEPAAVAPVGVVECIAEAERALELHQIETAASCAEQLAVADRELLRERPLLDGARRIRAAAGFLAREGGARAAEWSLRDGREGTVQGVGDGFMFELLDSEGETISVSLDEVETRSLSRSLARSRLPAEHQLGRAWLAILMKDTRTRDTALQRAAEESRWSDEVDRAVAYARGFREVPERGFTWSGGAWLTFAEREEKRVEVEIADALELLAALETRRQEQGADQLLDLGGVYPERVAEALLARRGELATAWQDAPELGRLREIASLHEELQAARKHALDLIYDTEKYFYPYRPPACPPERAKLYAEAQQEVDTRVQAVRELWGREGSEYVGPSVSLSLKTAPDHGAGRGAGTGAGGSARAAQRARRAQARASRSCCHVTSIACTCGCTPRPSASAPGSIATPRSAP